MPKTKKPAVEAKPVYIYMVQDYEREICGVFSTLQKASERFDHVLTTGLSQEDIDILVEEYGEDYHDELEYRPCILVHELDSNYVWSYDTHQEVKRALEEGENYD